MTEAGSPPPISRVVARSHEQPARPPLLAGIVRRLPARECDPMRWLALDEGASDVRQIHQQRSARDHRCPGTGPYARARPHRHRAPPSRTPPAPAVRRNQRPERPRDRLGNAARAPARNDRGGPASTIGAHAFHPGGEEAIELSLRGAVALLLDYVGTEHLLLGIACEGSGTASRALADLGATTVAIEREVAALSETRYRLASPGRLRGLLTAPGPA